MWPELREEVEVELQMLDRHLEQFADLRRKALQQSPDHVQIMALAGMLHTFYTGVENIFKRVSVHCDGGPPEGPAWHQNLLSAMASSTPERPAVISESLREKLRGYLDFRHFFRQSYSFQLQWDKMAWLVEDCEETFEQFKTELNQFLETGRGDS